GEGRRAGDDAVAGAEEDAPDIRDQLIAAIAYDKMLAIHADVGGQVCDEGGRIRIGIEVIVLEGAQRHGDLGRWRVGAFVAVKLYQSLDRHTGARAEGIERFAGDIRLHTGNLGTDLYPCVHALHGSSSNVTSLFHTTALVPPPAGIDCPAQYPSA